MFVVTGANGFIGSALVWHLNQQGISDILCVDSVSLNERNCLLEPLEYSAFSDHETFFNDFVDSDKYSAVKAIFHMGACSDTTEQDEAFLQKNNTDYTNKLFERCAELEIPYIYASSGAIYGDGNEGFNDGDSPSKFKPLNLYGESKLKSDDWILKQTKTPPSWYGLRFFNVYGPNESHKDHMRSLVHKAVGQINETQQLKLFKSYDENYKDGEQMRDFVYVKDIVRWMLELYQEKKFDSGIYNLGFGKARTWLDLASAVFQNLNLELKIDWIEMPDRLKNQYQYFTEANMERLFAQGLSQPEWSLEKGVADYVQNFMNPDKFLNNTRS